LNRVDARAPGAARRALAASSRRRDEQLRRLKTLAGLPFEAASADIVAMREFANLPSTMFAEAGAIFAESP
jgi:hypothetical protein